MFGHTDPASYTDYRVYMAGVLVPMLLLVSIRNLKYLSPVSMLANLLQFAGLGITFYFLLQADMQAMFDDVDQYLLLLSLVTASTLSHFTLSRIYCKWAIEQDLSTYNCVAFLQSANIFFEYCKTLSHMAYMSGCRTSPTSRSGSTWRPGPSSRSTSAPPSTPSRASASCCRWRTRCGPRWT